MNYSINKNKLFTFFLPLLILAFLVVFQWKILASFVDVMAMKAGAEGGINWHSWQGLHLPSTACKVAIEAIFTIMCFLYPSKAMLQIAFRAFIGIICLYCLGGFLLPPSMGFGVFPAFDVSFTLFAEIWMILGFTLFWGYVNDICKLGDAWNYYFAWSGIGILVGYNAAQLFEMNFLSRMGGEYYCATLIVTGILIERIFNFLKTGEGEQFANTDLRTIQPVTIKLSASQLWKYIFWLGVLTVSYTVSMYFIESVWQMNIKDVFSEMSNAAAYMERVSKVSLIMQMLVLAFFFLFHLMLYDPVRWRHVSLIPPVLMLGFGGGYLVLVLFGSNFDVFQSVFSMSAQQFALQAMMYLYFLPLSLKAFLFTPSLKMAFFPIPPRYRFGVLIGVTALFSELAAAACPIVYAQIALSPLLNLLACVIFLGVISAWILAVFTIGRAMDRHISAEALGCPPFHQDKWCVEKMQRVPRTLFLKVHE